VITVETDTQTQTLQNVIGGGHAGGQLLPRHFGLGDATTAKITVLWPDGTSTQHMAQAGDMVLIEKP